MNISCPVQSRNQLLIPSPNSTRQNFSVFGIRVCQAVQSAQPGVLKYPGSPTNQVPVVIICLAHRLAPPPLPQRQLITICGLRWVADYLADRSSLVSRKQLWRHIVPKPPDGEGMFPTKWQLRRLLITEDRLECSECVLWFLTPFSLNNGYKSLEGTHYFQLQGLCPFLPLNMKHIFIRKLASTYKTIRRQRYKTTMWKKSFRFKFLSNHWSTCVCLNQSYGTELVWFCRRKYLIRFARRTFLSTIPIDHSGHSQGA